MVRYISCQPCPVHRPFFGPGEGQNNTCGLTSSSKASNKNGKYSLKKGEIPNVHVHENEMRKTRTSTETNEHTGEQPYKNFWSEYIECLWSVLHFPEGWFFASPIYNYSPSCANSAADSARLEASPDRLSEGTEHTRRRQSNHPGSKKRSPVVDDEHKQKTVLQ